MLNLFVEDIDFWEFRFVEKERKGKERKGKGAGQLRKSVGHF
jgi:hypothetical protein